MPSSIELRLQVDFETAFHHGSGHSLAGVVDRAILRDSAGIPYIAGSTVKGRFRHTLLRLLTTLHPDSPPCHSAPFCHTPRPGHPEDPPLCDLCRLFGSPRREGLVDFTDLRPVHQGLLAQLIQTSASPVVAGGTEVRATTAIHPATRTVLPQHLFSTEVVAGFTAFEGLLIGRLDDADILLLQRAASLIDTFGAGSSRGLGFCSCHLTQSTGEVVA